MRLFLLALLYVNQGLPAGFFLQALPVLLRQQGSSAKLVGALSLLAAPWMLKALWAPWVDRTGSPRFGRRKSWIVPLQIALTLLLVALAWTTLPPLLFAGVFLVNLVVATADIAVDGLAVETLSAEDRATGNALQAGGYKIGMLIGGGLLPGLFLGAHAADGWTPALLAIAACTVPPMLAAWFFPERAAPAPEAEPVEKSSLRGAFVAVFAAITAAGWFVAFAVFSKFGDSLGTSMFRVFLVDEGWGADRIAWTIGTVGLVTSILGSFVMILPLRRWSRTAAFALATGFQALFLGLVGVGASLGWQGDVWVSLLALEHFASGMVTTALFTILMDRTSLRAAGTGFTVLSMLTTVGMGLGSFGGGALVDAVGHAPTFLLGSLLTLAPAWLLMMHGRKASAGAEAAVS